MRSMIRQRQVGRVTTQAPAPNARLIEMAADLTPGDALELGSGNGGDALWLARRGWNVTAFDISQPDVDRLVGLGKVAGLGHRIAAAQLDLNEGLPERHFDLVNAHYLHASQPLHRSGLFRAAAHALSPGGHLLIVDHGSVAPWSWNQDPDIRFPSPREVHAEIALDSTRWVIVRAEIDQRLATGPDGRAAEVTDHILMIRRTAEEGR